MNGLPLQAILRRALAAFTYRDFRVLWFGAFTSTVGTWMQKVAQSWLILELTKSAFYLGLDDFLGQLPILLLTLIGGVIADRHDRRRLLLSSQYVQMATALTLAALVYWGRVDIWHILALSFIAGLAQAFGGPGLSVAGADARREEGSAERHRAELDPVQPGARVRAAARRRHARRLRHGALLRAERRLVPRRHRRAAVAEHQAHPARPSANRSCTI